jgi:hypothetical protein
MGTGRQSSGTRKEGRFWLTADIHVSAATDTHPTIKELSRAVFSMRSVPWLYSEDHPERLTNHGYELALYELVSY